MAVILFIFIIFLCHCAVYMYKIMILQKSQPISTKFHTDPTVEMWLIVYSNDHAPLTVRPIYSFSKLRTAQMMIFSLVAMIGLEKCCITSAYLQWLGYSGERAMARRPLVFFYSYFVVVLIPDIISNLYNFHFWDNYVLSCRDSFGNLVLHQTFWLQCFISWNYAFTNMILKKKKNKKYVMILYNI